MQLHLEGSLPWEEEDQLAWREFLNTNAGRRIFPKALEGVPALLSGGDTNALLVRSGEVRGWQQAISAALQLAAPPPKPPRVPTEYPVLEDDVAWGDGLIFSDAPKTGG